MTCDDCDATMVFHKDRRIDPARRVVRCHHCLSELLPTHCPACERRSASSGSARSASEEELSREFPDLVSGDTMLRLDSDTMRVGKDYFRALERFRSGAARVLLGTQMVAKGLDFPNVRLVGVVHADTAINLPDFRAGERTFQLISQVAGRAGRSDKAGAVIVQTLAPHTPAVRFAARHDYEGFAREEPEQRERAGLPPFARMARIVLRRGLLGGVGAGGVARGVAAGGGGRVGARPGPDALPAQPRRGKAPHRAGTARSDRGPTAGGADRGSQRRAAAQRRHRRGRCRSRGAALNRWPVSVATRRADRAHRSPG